MDIATSIHIDDNEIVEEFVRASGPGGQNVNKVATAVQLRFDVRRSPSLPEDVRQRLVRLAHGQMTSDGVLVINARMFRTQARNREEARRRLAGLLRQAAVRPRQRLDTRPTAAARRRRLESKRLRGQAKTARHAAQGRSPSDWED